MKKSIDKAIIFDKMMKISIFYKMPKQSKIAAFSRKTHKQLALSEQFNIDGMESGLALKSD